MAVGDYLSDYPAAKKNTKTRVEEPATGKTPENRFVSDVLANKAIEDYKKGAREDMRISFMSALDDANLADDLFREGMKLKVAGDLYGAFDKFSGALELLRRHGVLPPFAVSIEEALRGVESELRKIVFERTPKIISFGSGLNATDEFLNVVAAKEELEKMKRVFPDEREVVLADKKAGEYLKQVSNRIFSRAIVVEKYGDCARAVQMYRELADGLKNIETDITARAEEGIKRCR